MVFIMSIIAIVGIAAAIGAGVYGVLAAGTAVCLGTTLLHSVEKKGSRFPY